MEKTQALQYISNAMSLRPPQQKSLQLFADYLSSEAGQLVLERMRVKKSADVPVTEAKTRAYAGGVTEMRQFQAFERTFPAFTLALATGVGKTRLMGAFITYLYLVYGMQHYLIVAPGNTIYRKLVDDFKLPNNPKYVFKGIAEINSNTARIITKDNYEQNQATAALFGNQVQINIFNVQQFAQKDSDKEKGITTYNETTGESYFEYLQSLRDLVVLLDESHHYHADAAMGSLDRIDPLFGLEFTATPYVASATTKRKAVLALKKNILYTYNLGDAIRDGFVKDPWVGTEADVDFSQYEQDSIETDARKLQLAAFFHERAKIALEEYASANNKPKVKPVMLVVAKDTDHASKLRALIDSDDFRGGAYKGKVIEVHTKTRGEETDENVEKLISLEHPDNIVEIVIHVNMLKEGWDVTNIYTIAPIRSSASEILTEQTIGRGLRLPYGTRTNNTYVDRVMIVAHENYAKVIEGARNSNIIKPTNIEQVKSEDTTQAKDVVEVPSAIVAKIEDTIKANPAIMAEIAVAASKAVLTVIAGDLPADVKAATVEKKKEEIIEDLAKAEAARLSFSEYHKQEPLIAKSTEWADGSLFSSFTKAAVEEIHSIGTTVGQNLAQRNIPVPRLILTPHYGGLKIQDFNLDTSRLSKYATETAILEQRLQAEHEKDLFGGDGPEIEQKVITKVANLGEGRKQSPENTIIAALIEQPLLDYEEQKDLLLKLTSQTVAYYRTFASVENTLKMVVEVNYRQIAKEIYDQILENKQYINDSYVESAVHEAKSTVDNYNFSVLLGDKPVSLASQVDTFSRDKVYSGFTKACHAMYRFDSSDEARFAYLLEGDAEVINWLRPAPNQFEGLYWRDENGETHHRYEPDFVVELKDQIVMVEVKPAANINNHDVVEKKKTAEKYCELVSKEIGSLGIVKPWRYIIVPTEKIKLSATVTGLLR